MNYREFYQMMQDGKLVSANWRHVLGLLDDPQLSGIDDYLKTLILYFSLLEEGNVYMTLDASDLKTKFEGKIKGLQTMAKEEDEQKNHCYDVLLDEISDIASKASNIVNFSKAVSNKECNKLFVVEENKLYTRKNYKAAKSVLASITRLFPNKLATSSSFNYRQYVDPSFVLSKGQEEIIEKGAYNNLLITGGPGTGKTTSVLFLLLSLLIKKPEYNVYLAAPSGKAASRMKDSILNGLSRISGIDKELTDKIEALDTYTIHRLLKYDPHENRFSFNAKCLFPKNSIFVIDEASMIDVNLFADLLEAIPNEASLFVLGDKNQLPSVECGAVFGELLSFSSLKDNIVELVESKRFKAGSKIDQLAQTINAGGSLLYIENEWQAWKDFEIIANTTSDTPIYYYLDDAAKQSEMIDSIAKKWYKEFYQKTNLQGFCEGITDEGEWQGKLNEIWQLCEEARILCACNEGARGIRHINNVILKEYYSDKESISGFYPGELLIVTRNNKDLDLYNGDSGVTVKFAGDDTLYLMLRKGTELRLDDEKQENVIFKLGDYLFYPIRMINRDDISPAFAITIHKSQGSDYRNILVVLPKIQGHPLLNRQIIYTAITRTKDSTYILSNQGNMQSASDTVVRRNTF